MRIFLSMLLAIMLVEKVRAEGEEPGGVHEISIAREILVSTNFGKLKKEWRSSSGMEIKPYDPVGEFREINCQTGKWGFFYYRLPLRGNSSKNQFGDGLEWPREIIKFGVLDLK